MTPLTSQLVTPAARPFSVEEVATIDDVPLGEWERLSAGGRLWQSRPWLRSVESDPGYRTRYLLLRDHAGGLAGALPAYYHAGPDLYAPYNPFLRFVDRPIGSARAEEWFPILLGGLGRGYGAALLVDQTLDPALRSIAIAQLLEGLTALGDRLGARTVALNSLLAPAATELAPHLGPSVQLLFTTAYAYFDCAAMATMDDYLASLGRRRGRNARIEMERFAASGCTITVEPLASCVDQCAPLLGLLQRHHGHDLDDAWARRMLEENVAAIGDRALAFLCRRDGELLGFSFGCEWDGVFYGRGVGYDHARVGDLPVYFNVGYYAQIRWALGRRLRSLEFGTSSYEVKLRRGCELAPLWSVVIGSSESPWRAALADWNRSQFAVWSDKLAPHLRAPLPEPGWQHLRA